MQRISPIQHSRGVDKLRDPPAGTHARHQLSRNRNLHAALGNQAIGWLLSNCGIQAKFKIGSPNDVFEREADRVAELVMRKPTPGQDVSVHSPENAQCRNCDETLQRKSGNQNYGKNSNTVQQVGTGFNNSTATGKRLIREVGEPLPETSRTFFEPRFGEDFSHVRVHTGNRAAALAQSINARAFTVGRDIVFGAGQYQPDSPEGRRLLAHELTHTVQQQSRSSQIVKNHNSEPRIQRRLVTFGTLPDVNALLGLLGPQAGLTLNMNVANNQVQIGAVLPGAPPSPTLRARLTAIINHATQHAEVIIARGQPQVFVGAFPQPSDLTVTRVQQIDIDDILAIEAGAPGNGVAFAMHEIEENFQAHGVVPVAGVDRFAAAHRQAETQAENPVASELVTPGNRVAFVQVPGTIVPGFTVFGVNIPGFVMPAANTTAMFFDYENYYLGVTSQTVAATQDVQVANARRFPKTVVSARTIDNFVSGSNALPPASAATIAAVVADVAANPTATVLIQGFTDNTGSAATNLTVSQQRANSAQVALQAAGVGGLRIHAAGLGAVNFVAPNVTPADRARNRRVVITVTRPQL